MSGHISTGLSGDRRAMGASMDPNDRDRHLLEAITKAHTEFVDLVEPMKLFDGLLELLLNITNSEYGFIGEILHSDEGRPYLKTFSITNIAWNKETRKFYEENAPQGMEFHNLKTLFGQVMVTRERIISNHPGTDPRRGGLPEGHPPLNAFLGLPVNSGGSMIGMAGIANRPGGYDTDIVSFLEPFLLTCGNFIRTIRANAERREVGEALKESEVRSRAVLDSTLDAVITTDDEGTIESVNPATEKLFGYKASELIGRNVNSLMPEPDRSRHHSYMSRYLKTGEAKIIGTGRETVALRKDGSRFPIDLAISELSVPGRHLFTGIVKDISERKVAQTSLEETLAQLEASNENMLAILNETRLGIVMLDENGRVMFASRSCENLLEQPQEKLRGQPWDKVCPFTARQKETLRALFNADDASRNRLDARLSLGDGREFWTEVEVRDDPRNPSGKIIFMYDVTEVHRLRSRLNTATSRQMIGNSRAMLDLFDHLDKVAPGDWTVLIEGETGVGKEMVARALHAASPRNDGPFIPVNCGGLTDSLLTSQLFGHRRGAFTGAIADQDGVFEAANGGTIFLDEIGDVPMGVQTALLRVIQEREITRVGESRPRKIDVRILAATNRDLDDEVKSGRFRKDFLYRIRVARISVPPLRERKEDIPLLTMSFLAEGRATAHKRVVGVEPAAMRRMIEHSWPGNVRELKNAIETATIACSTPVIGIGDLPAEITGPGAPAELEPAPGDSRSRLLDAMKRAGGNRSRAALLLGISRATLYRRLAEAGIDTKQSRAGAKGDKPTDQA
jgi:PAS domain S-box-containing protein